MGHIPTQGLVVSACPHGPGGATRGRAITILSSVGPWCPRLALHCSDLNASEGLSQASGRVLHLGLLRAYEVLGEQVRWCWCTHPLRLPY